jgi:hypothetical protein
MEGAPSGELARVPPGSLRDDPGPGETRKPRALRTPRSRAIRTGLAVAVLAWGANFTYQIATLRDTCFRALDDHGTAWTFAAHRHALPLAMDCTAYYHEPSNALGDLGAIVAVPGGTSTVWATGLRPVSHVHREFPPA